MNRVADLALGVGSHRPVQECDFLGAQPRPRREEEGRSISLRVPGGGQVREDRLRLAFG